MLPRAGQECCGGPFGPSAVAEGTQQVPGLPALVDWAALVAATSTPSQAARAARWASLLQYTQQAVAVANASFFLQAAVQAPGGLDRARALALLPQATGLRDLYSNMVTLLLGALGSPGELGMLAAHEGGASVCVSGRAERDECRRGTASSLPPPPPRCEHHACVR